MNNIGGVYGIKSIHDQDRVYIGSTTDLRKRYREHFNALRRGDHCNEILQRHYNKYGQEDLLFEVLFLCDDNDLIDAEQHFIDTLKPFFNLCQIAGTCHGAKRTNETKVKMSRGRKCWGTCNRKMLINIETGIFYDSIIDAAASVNINQNTFGQQFRGRYLIGKRFIVV